MIDRITDVSYQRNQNSKDFVVRKRYPTMLQLFVTFIAVLLIGFSIIIAVNDKLSLTLLIFVLGGASAWYAATVLQRNRDQLLATEFQNALFASALGMNHKFCFIIKRDGNIIYQDRSFQDMFPHFIRQPSRTLDSLLDYGKVSSEEKNAIFRAIEQGDYQKVVFDVRGSDGKFERVLMNMEPILRPSGFILMRGREFVESRSADDSMFATESANPFSKSTLSVLSNSTEMTQSGLYMTNSSGQVVYLNPLLLKWLEYSEKEIDSARLTLQDLVHPVIGKLGTFEPGNFQGEMLLQKKNGGMVKCFISQSWLYDERRKSIGCAGMVQHMVEHSAEAKKKTW